MFCILSRRCPLLATSLSVLFCLLSILISDSRFDLVWFRLSRDHGWIRSGSVNVRKQEQQKQHTFSSRLLILLLLLLILLVIVIVIVIVILVAVCNCICNCNGTAPPPNLDSCVLCSLSTARSSKSSSRRLWQSSWRHGKIRAMSSSPPS